MEDLDLDLEMQDDDDAFLNTFFDAQTQELEKEEAQRATQGDRCNACGGELEEVDGIFFCVDCQTQAVGLQLAVEDEALADDDGQIIVTHEIAGMRQKNKNPIEYGSKWSSLEAFNLIICLQAEIIEKSGLCKEGFFETVHNIWFQYLIHIGYDRLFHAKDTNSDTLYEIFTEMRPFLSERDIDILIEEKDKKPIRKCLRNVNNVNGYRTCRLNNDTMVVITGKRLLSNSIPVPSTIETGEQQKEGEELKESPKRKTPRLERVFVESRLRPRPLPKNSTLNYQKLLLPNQCFAQKFQSNLYRVEKAKSLNQNSKNSSPLKNSDKLNDSNISQRLRSAKKLVADSETHPASLINDLNSMAIDDDQPEHESVSQYLESPSSQSPHQEIKTQDHEIKSTPRRGRNRSRISVDLPNDNLDQDQDKELEDDETEEQRKIRYAVRTKWNPYSIRLLTLCRTLTIIEVAARLRKEIFFISDIIRLVDQGFLPYFDAVSHFPDDWYLDYKDVHVFSGVRSGSRDALSMTTYSAALLNLLNPNLKLTPPNLRKVCERLLIDMNLPLDLIEYAQYFIPIDKLEEILTVDFSTCTIPPRKLPIYERSAMAWILLTLRILFVLNDEFEHDISGRARLLSGPQTFLWTDWEHQTSSKLKLIKSFGFGYYRTGSDSYNSTIETCKFYETVAHKWSTAARSRVTRTRPWTDVAYRRDLKNFLMFSIPAPVSRTSFIASGERKITPHPFRYAYESVKKLGKEIDNLYSDVDVDHTKKSVKFYAFGAIPRKFFKRGYWSLVCDSHYSSESFNLLLEVAGHVLYCDPRASLTRELRMIERTLMKELKGLKVLPRGAPKPKKNLDQEQEHKKQEQSEPSDVDEDNFPEDRRVSRRSTRIKTKKSLRLAEARRGRSRNQSESSSLVNNSLEIEANS